MRFQIDCEHLFNLELCITDSEEVADWLNGIFNRVSCNKKAGPVPLISCVPDLIFSLHPKRLN